MTEVATTADDRVFRNVDWYHESGQPIRVPPPYKNAGTLPMRFRLIGNVSATWNEAAKFLDFDVGPGPVGPAGPQGLTGDPGPTGATGLNGTGGDPLLGSGSATTLNIQTLEIARFTLDEGHSYIVRGKASAWEPTTGYQDGHIGYASAYRPIAGAANLPGSGTSILPTAKPLSTSVSWATDGNDLVFYGTGVAVKSIGWRGEIYLEWDRQP